MAAVFERFQADRFAAKRFADEHLSPSPFDRAVVPDLADLESVTVFGVAKFYRIAACRRLIRSHRRFLSQRFVWTLFVVFTPPPIEATLLLPAGAARRLQCLLVQRQMEPFMSPVLLRPSRLDPLDKFERCLR
jgi:hypothetical protein